MLRHPQLRRHLKIPTSGAFGTAGLQQSPPPLGLTEGLAAMAEAATVAVAGGNIGEDNCGAVEEMDQDGSDVDPCMGVTPRPSWEAP